MKAAFWRWVVVGLGVVQAALPDAMPQAQTMLERAAQSKAQREKELSDIRTQMEAIAAERARIDADVNAIRTDHDKLVKESIAIAARVRELETTIAATEARLKRLGEEEAKIRASLHERRAIIADVLAALQRMGRRPPPALVVDSQDFITSLRTAMLLATLLPELRETASVLARDLNRLDSVHRAAKAEYGRLTVEKASIEQNRLRLAALVEARRSDIAKAEQSSEAERKKAETLARQANDLHALVMRMNVEIEAARKLEDGQKHATDRRQAMAALASPSRIEPSIAFEQAKGQVPLPVNGMRVRELPQSEGGSGKEQGLYLVTRPEAQVIAPADGWVVYSGPFRKYGHVLILNVGSKHLILIAGMERAGVDSGQFVVKGEPVGTMGRVAQQAGAVMTGRSEPILYIEFRKDGVAIDPTQWWQTQPVSDPDEQKARG